MCPKWHIDTCGNAYSERVIRISIYIYIYVYVYVYVYNRERGKKFANALVGKCKSVSKSVFKTSLRVCEKPYDVSKQRMDYCDSRACHILNDTTCQPPNLD